MFNGLFHIREPRNEPVLTYAPGSQERAELKAELSRMLRNPVEVPCIIGGREISTGDLVELRPPHDLHSSLGRYHRASAHEAELARLDGDIIAIDVFMKDVNGPKGGIDKAAMIRIHLRQRREVAIETVHENLGAAIRVGAKRAKRAVRRSLRKARRIEKFRINRRLDSLPSSLNA